MRKQLLGVSLPLLLVVLMAAAETQSTGTETKHATLQKVNVVQGEDGITLEITARGTVTPKLSTLNSPARLVLDLPNTALATSTGRINVARDGVQDVRIGSDRQASPTSRIVIDLDHACKYELVPSEDNKIVLKLHSGVSAAKVAKPTPVVTAAVATPIVVSAPKAAVTAPVLDTKLAPAPSVAGTFVVVEPTFKPKSCDHGCRKRSARPSGRGCLQIRGETRHQLTADAQRRHAATSCANREHSFPARGKSGSRAKGAVAATARSERPQVHRRANFGEPERCGLEGLLPLDSRDQRIERSARS